MIQQWLRYIDTQAQTRDKNRARWPEHPVWLTVQCAYAGNEDEKSARDPRGEQACRLDALLEEKPLAALAHASCLALETTLQDAPLLEPQEVTMLLGMTCRPPGWSLLALAFVSMCNVIEQRIHRQVMLQSHAIKATFPDPDREALDVVRELAGEEVAKLTPEQVAQVVDLNSSDDFEKVQERLIRRSRRMARKKMCVASLAGYLTSIMALSPDEVAEQPDLQASLVVAFEEVKKYNRERGRSHLEQVWKKRLAYGFVTVHQLEEEKRLYGIELTDDDWLRVERAQQLMREEVDA